MHGIHVPVIARHKLLGAPRRRVRSAYRPPLTMHVRVTRFGGHGRFARPIRAAPAVSYDYRPNRG
jgi:hypothetical protein